MPNMEVQWNYTQLASPYLNRPDYASPGIDEMLRRSGIGAGARACDVGAGWSHLTIPLLERGLRVDAVEPNDAMRALGRERTAVRSGVEWFEGTGEPAARPDEAYD